jgi:hypothetical protein
MKRLIAVVLVCLLCATSAFAAEWPEGLGPDQPLPGVRKLDLTKEMGYCYTFPKPGLEVSHFCNVLEIYLPREDIELGQGHAHLYDSTDTEIADIDFANPEQVLLRTQEEAELAAKKWGGGVCIEMNLPVSLKFDESYYVLMDLNCFTACDGKISNYDLAKPDQWTPILQGDFGIGGLFYCAPPEPQEAEEGAEEATEATEAPEDQNPEDAAEPMGEPKYNPVVGDMIHFDLLLGGDAKTAVVFSENDSVFFEKIDYTESGHVTGTVTKDALDWGVVFLDENDEALQVIKPAWTAQGADQNVGQDAGQAEAGQDAGQEAEQSAEQDAEQEAEQDAAQAD